MTVFRDDRGSATAEFAVVVPAVVLVVVLAVGGLAAAGRQVRLEQGVAQAARLAARGEPADRVAGIVSVVAGGTVDSIVAEGELLCVAASAPARIPLPLPDLQARSCALSGGR